MKLTRKYINVLAAFASEGQYLRRSALPDGNGRAGEASLSTLRELTKAGYLDYVINRNDGCWAWRSNSKGMAAISPVTESPSPPPHLPSRST